MSPRHKLTFFLAAACWLPFAWAQQAWFMLPCMDSWCYFAPSVAASRGFHLVQPMLGSFGGADHAWGIHWPGALLLNSALFAGTTDFIVWAVAWNLVLWLGSAACLAGLAWRVSHRTGFALSVFLLLLGDRSGFILVAYQRMELVTLPFLCVLSAAIVAQARRAEVSLGGRVLRGAAFLACPLLHPLAIAFGGASLALLAWMRRGRQAWRETAVDALCLAGGGGALAAWIFLQPDVLAQFRDHARTAADIPFGIGPFLYAMKIYYAPLFTGLLLYLPGLAGIFFLWRDFSVRETTDPNGGRATLFAFTVLGWVMFVTLHLRPNPIYLVLLLPAVIPAAAELWRRLMESSPAWWKRPRLLAAAGATLVLLHGAFWATRSLKWIEVGKPNLRAELDAFWRSLPTDVPLLVPETLWEQAVADRTRTPVALANTLPYWTTMERRQRYEQAIYPGLPEGTVLVTDRFQSRMIARGVDPRLWRQERSASHLISGRGGDWGYDFVVYRRTGVAPSEPVP